MSDVHERVGNLETTVARQGERMTHMERTLEHTANGVDQLLQRDAQRPEPASLKTVVATLLTTGAAVGMLGGFTWWLVASAPIVQELDKRMDRLDDPVVGRVPALERKVKRLEGWEPRIVRSQ